MIVEFNDLKISEETRFKVPDAMKYFCMSEAVAYYLQKYVVYRKRKIFFGMISELCYGLVSWYFLSNADLYV